jgi:hemoglobin
MSIYNEIGGRAAVAAAVDDFYVRVLDDDTLAPYFRGVDMPRQKSHLRAFIAGALGGPELYDGRDMHAAHARLGITGAAFDRVVGHLADTLIALRVPQATIDRIAATLAPLRAQIVTA